MAIPLLLLLITAAVLWPVCVHEFTDWDDGINVTQNPYLNPPTTNGLLFFWAHAYDKLYVPLTYTGWWLLARIARLDAPDEHGIWLDPYVFHAVNLLLHMAACFVLYQLLLRLCKHQWPALAGALLFAIHPVQVEAVAWVTGLKDVLCGFLSLLAMWQYVAFAQAAWDSERNRLRWSHYIAATIALTAALLAKPSAVTVPILALILDRLVLQRSWRAVSRPLVPWFAIAAGFVGIGLLSQRAPANYAGPLWPRPIIAADALAFYLGKIAFPLKLGVLYDYAPRTVVTHAWGWIMWIVPLALAATAYRFVRTNRAMLASLAILFIAPLPVLGLVSFEFEQYSVVADRYIYVAMLGPALALAFLLKLGSPMKWLPLVCALWLAALGVRAYAQTRTWQDSATLFENAVKVNPNSAAAYAHLAGEALAARRLGEADELANRSIALDSRQVSAYLILGSILQPEGRHVEEEAAYRHAIDNDPNDPAALTDLAAVLAENPGTGKARLREAINLCQRAIAIAPGDPAARQILASIGARAATQP